VGRRSHISGTLLRSGHSPRRQLRDLYDHALTADNRSKNSWSFFALLFPDFGDNIRNFGNRLSIRKGATQLCQLISPGQPNSPPSVLRIPSSFRQSRKTAPPLTAMPG